MSNVSLLLNRSTWAAVAVALVIGAQAQDQHQDDWPLVFTSGGYQVQVFKPQPESFDGTSFTARAAVALQRPSDNAPVFGAIWGNGILEVDRDNRMGKLTTFKVTDARFPGITDPDELVELKDMLSREVPRHSALIPIDWLVAALDEERQSSSAYDNAPPTILYREKPTILVYIDGPPIYEVLPNTGTGGDDPVYETGGRQVERVKNTPFLLVRPKGGDLWLHGSGLWYSARDIDGPWTYQKNAPDYLKQLAQQVDTVPEAVPAPDAVIPDVLVSTKPAVLLDLNGKPQLQPLENSSLMYVTNTDKDLFMEIPTQDYYLLASGRWYATKNLKDGPWHYVAPDELPADFANVQEGSPKDGILAHVAGTDAAREAVRDASIPQTAQVDRNTATVTVTYDGDPQFQRIEGTDVYSALNASTTVLRIDGVYHVCDNAVWYEGDSPTGPWKVSIAVPPQVNQIPPSDPAYRVRYVYIYDHTPDQVFVGYTPGYLGSYVQDGTVVYGTGYYYASWPGHWYPRPFTWGFNMYYNPWYGWGFGPTWGYTWFYPSWIGYGYSHGHGHFHYSWGWWGPYAYCPQVNWHAHGYYGHHPSIGTGSATEWRGASTTTSMHRGSDLYANHRVVGVKPSEVRRDPLTFPEEQSGARSMAKTALPIPGDHFTDSQGNVYRGDGTKTQEYRNGKWSTLRNQGKEAQPGTNATSRQRPPENSGRSESVKPNYPDRRSPSQNMHQSAPQQIQKERSRGDQRVDDYRGYQQMQRSAPAIQRPAPQTRPGTPSPRPSTPSGGRSGRSGGHR